LRVLAVAVLADTAVLAAIAVASITAT